MAVNREVAAFMPVSIDPRLCRAGRALLGWSQAELARRSNVAERTIAAFELGERNPRDTSRERLQTALEEGGVVFLGGRERGVRLKAGWFLEEPKDG